MADVIVKVIDNRAVVQVAGAEALLRIAEAATRSNAERAEAALQEIQEIASGAPDAPSILDKAERDGSNIIDPEAFRQAIGANYLKAGDDPLRNHSQITVPFYGDGIFRDNVLGLRNNSIGLANGDQLCRGNAVINLLDSRGLEKGAMGYSRNSGHAPNAGYYGDLVFMSCGNPFSDDAYPSDWGITVEMKAGSPFWGGAFVSYFPIRISSQTGEIQFSTNGGIAGGQINFKDNTRVGTLGTPRVLAFAMTTTYARARESGAADQFTLTTNYSDPAAGGAPTPDDVTKPIWRVGFGGGLDVFKVDRFAPGLGQTAVELFRCDALGRFMVGQSATSPGADGRLSITASAGQTAVTAKSVTSGVPAIIAYNAAATGDSLFVAFGVNASYAQAGSIDYNRAANQVRYNVTSDHRAKDVLGPITDATSRLRGIEVSRIRMHGATEEIDGFVAHQLQGFAPYAVSGFKDEADLAGRPIFQQVDQSKVVPLVVASLQHAHDRIDAIEDRLAA